MTISQSCLRHAMAEATTYEEWLDFAQQLDQRTGADEWRAEDRTELLHSRLIRDHQQRLNRLYEQGDWQELAALLTESLYRHLSELNNPELYQGAWSGPKQIVVDYLDTIERCLRGITAESVPGISPAHKLALLEQAERVFGKPALILSGGAAFGIYHLGVVKSLWQAGLMPRILAGSSMGAIMATAICSRSDAELTVFFREQLESVDRIALKWRDWQGMRQHRSLLDERQVMQHIVANAGSHTFKEAFERSGRVLNITVSPTRTHQKPRLLNYLSAPDVLIETAAQASCAVPGLFPPVLLKARRADGEEKPYFSTERWIDGSVHGDLPRERLARLFNVNQTIVSQANPHVIPFIHNRQHRGMRAKGQRVAVNLLQANTEQILDISRQALGWTPLRSALRHVHAMASQSYLGDITIQFPFHPLAYRRVLSNPTPEGLKQYIRWGEQATWPQLAMIRETTRVSRVLNECIDSLRAQQAVYL